ncbi:MAG: antibiotic ABC transporter ATP-binding protein [Bacteroidetes bacterium GWF2_33_16]|nr:MAG: antibiotic ABC transporter ATP-binding protein [Bacteroidetes bacterium GWE2_32_14]OFY05268.1 MAG: antibiotic ABC transporter ATP-binding protein [Bacteroidetes bacterium GWF2_33_16]
MKGVNKIIRYMLPYWDKGALSIFYSLVGTVFSIFSFAMVIPFLGVLFSTQPRVTELVKWQLTSEAVGNNFNYYLSQIIDTQGPEAALLSVSFLVVFFVLLKTFFQYMSNYVMAPLRSYVIRDMRNKLNKKILELQLSYFTEERKGDLISRMTGDVQEVEASIVRSLNNAIKMPLTIIIYLIILFMMSPMLTVIVLVLIPLSGFIIGRIGKSLRRKSIKGQAKLGLILSYIEETLFGLRIIKAFNSEKKIDDRFRKENGSYAKLMTRIWRKKELAGPFSEFMATVVIVLVMWLGGNLVLSQDAVMSPQTFIAYIVIFSQIIPPAKEVSNVYYNLQRGLASLDRINGILDAEVTIIVKENATPVKDFKESIEYKNVSFKYIQDYVLKNINLKIEKGKTIALVGQSGSGKSTLVDLLPRFYDILEGDILIDGNNIKDLDLIDLRNLMGNVNQESILFNDTIYNNIAFGMESATEQEIIAAAKVANAHEFILQTENGYQTNIGDRGTKLSGGQRQRVSIARAVLKNPPILILDEATSALDTESEKLVQDAIFNLMKNRTSIVIAHRLSTVREADEICVLHEGEIVERGKHDVLLSQNGIYKKLHDLQMFA